GDRPRAHEHGFANRGRGRSFLARPSHPLWIMKAFLPDQTRISQVHLRTAKIECAVGFYTDVLGLKLLHGPGSQAILSATGEGPGLLELTEDMNAPLRPPRSTGLYHFAIRYPTRRDLAHALVRLLQSEYPIQGGSD